MAHKEEQFRAEARRLTAEEVGARVGAILSDAEREAREIIAAARTDGIDASLPPEHQLSRATFDDLTQALEGLTARFDAFELSTAAQIEQLGAQLRDALAGVLHPPAAAVEPIAPRLTVAPVPSAEEASQLGAARVRAVDLALAGYSREAIANELSTSLSRVQVDSLLDDVLVG